MTSDDISDLMPDIKRWYKKVSKKRFKRFGRYRLDRWLFQAGMFLIFGWLFFVANWYHYDLDYYKCGTADVPHYMQKTGEESCRNLFYKPPTWKNQEYLPPGEYGTQLGPMFRSTFYAPFLIFGLAFALNQLIHNRKQRRLR